MHAPQNVGERVAAILSHRLQVEGVSESTDLFEAAALDSLGLVELLVGLEEEFGIAISAADLELDRFRSIAAISAFVSSKIERRNGHDLGPRRLAVK
ncbi:MAG TPA: phosphopantetheine-binding protein [Thermoanaerobaculia bacterium]|nr:phosphopantetheine-binding protein [Thermoanaerobaculia bacterium]